MEPNNNWKIQDLQYTNNFNFMFLQSQKITIRSLELDEGNKYPSIYFDAVLTTTIKDTSKSIIYPEGCTNLDSKAGTQNIQCDWEHAGFYANARTAPKVRNAGIMLKASLDNESDPPELNGSFRVGKEHNLIDKYGKIYGSSYGSAWLMYASEQVNINGGSVDDYIPEHIRDEYITKNTVALKSVSVQADYGPYETENYTDLNGTLHIHKFDIVSVGFLTHSPPGQSQSVIKKETVAIRSKQENNQNNMPNTTLIRCLCDYSNLWLGQYLYDNVLDEMYRVVAGTESLDPDQPKVYTVENIITGVQTTQTLDEFKLNENLDNAWTDKVWEFILTRIIPILNANTAVRSIEEEKLPKATMTLIRMCQSCQKQTSTKSAETETKVEAKTEDTIVPPVDEKAQNDLTVILESLKSIESRLETLETASTNTTATRSKEEDTETPATDNAEGGSTSTETPEDSTKSKDDTTAIRSFQPATKAKPISATAIRLREEKPTNAGQSALTLKL
jgi:hypothetical protein